MKKGWDVVGTGEGMAERLYDVKEDTGESSGGVRGEQSAIRLPGQSLIQEGCEGLAVVDG